MTHRKPGNNLSLDRFEGTASQLILLKLSPDQIESVIASGILALGHKFYGVQIWQQMKVGDLVLCFTIGETNQFLACIVSARKVVPLVTADPLRIKEERPFIVFLRVVGQTSNFKIKNEAFYFLDSQLRPPRYIFQQLWEQCKSVERAIESISLSWRPWIYSRRNSYRIGIASSYDDFLYISKVAAHHPFGPRRAFLSLLAYDESEPVGAILLERGMELHTGHRAAWRVFRRDYSWIQARSINIVRIYSNPIVRSKFGLHRALLEVALEIAPALIEQPISIIEGVSYAYHPLAWDLGFHVEFPQKPEESFYYWKAFNVPSPIPVATRAEFLRTKSRIKEMLGLRKSLKYWFAYGRPEDIELGVQKLSWAIRKQHPNTGRWSALQEGNIIFLLTRDQKVRSYGVVASKEIKKIRHYEQFPLLVHFFSSMVIGLNIDVSEQVAESWFRRIEPGGITPMPDEFGAKIKALADEQRKEGKMWVEPNPYILHKTNFDVVHGQVFVVQAWDLRDTVYPMIKTILEAENYKVTYSGDRDGQLVFEDIWLMLNESEAILVDFTLRRPNVYLEYGMALVLGKPIIAITQSRDDIPSDTPNLKYIMYMDKLNDQALHRQLPRAIRDVINDIQMMRSQRSSSSAARG